MRDFGRFAAGEFGKEISNQIKDILDGKFDNMLCGLIWEVISIAISTKAFEGFVKAATFLKVLRTIDNDLRSFTFTCYTFTLA